MSHTRFALGFPRNRKVARLSDAAFRLWASAMDLAREQLLDGALIAADLDLVPRCPTGKARTALVDELVNAGLWEKTTTGWQIHDYLDWQDSAAKVKQKQAAARERMRSVRENNAPGSRPVRANTERTAERTSGEVTPTYSSLLNPDPDLPSGSFPISEPDQPVRLEPAKRAKPRTQVDPETTWNPAQKAELDRLGRDHERENRSFIAHHQEKGTLSASWTASRTKWVEGAAKGYGAPARNGFSPRNQPQQSNTERRHQRVLQLISEEKAGGQ